MKTENKATFFKAYVHDWRAIANAVTPQQGWELLNMCLDYANNGVAELSNDPLVNAFYVLLNIEPERDSESR